MTGPVTVEQFINHAMCARFELGRNDCMLFAADWVRLMTGKDPAAAWRGRYSTKGEAETIIANAGGMIELVGGQVEWPRANEPMPGDIAVLLQETVRAPFGAICGRGIWYARALRGVSMLRAREVTELAIWRNPCLPR